MKTLSLLLLLFVFSLSIVAQSSTSDSLLPCLYKVCETYDKLDDSTILRLQTSLIQNSIMDGKQSLMMDLISKFDGTKPTDNNLILLTLDSIDISRNYSPTSSLVFLIDDSDRIRPKFAKYDSSSDRLMYLDIRKENVSFVISQEDLKKLALSKSNRARLDSTEFTFDDISLKYIREFHEKLVP